MNKVLKFRWMATTAVLCVLSALAAPQLGQIIKILGVNEIVKRYGKDIDREFNKMIKRSPSTVTTTKVVPIITGGIGSRKAVGIVQVSGPKARIGTVKAVAQVEQEFLGQLRIQAMIPIASEQIIENMHPVEQVGVTGIVDIKL